MNNPISKSEFLVYLHDRLNNARKGIESNGIRSHYPLEAKRFQFEYDLIPKLVNAIQNDIDFELTGKTAIWMDYLYWHCVLMVHCWHNEFIEDGFFGRMAEAVYKYRDEQLGDNNGY